jgi:hypothetical protein
VSCSPGVFAGLLRHGAWFERTVFAILKRQLGVPIVTAFFSSALG